MIQPFLFIYHHLFPSRLHLVNTIQQYATFTKAKSYLKPSLLLSSSILFFLFGVIGSSFPFTLVATGVQLEDFLPFPYRLFIFLFLLPLLVYIKYNLLKGLLACVKEYDGHVDGKWTYDGRKTSISALESDSCKIISRVYHQSLCDKDLLLRSRQQAIKI